MQHSKHPKSQSSRRWMAAALAVPALVLAACAQVPEESASGGNEPAKVEQIKGSDLSRVTLTSKAAERLNIKAVPVSEAQVAPSLGNAAAKVQRKVIPHAAVLYDAAGDTWTFTNPQPLVFVRHRITVDYIDGDLAILADGPASGTPVVAVGAAELYGAELGVE